MFRGGEKEADDTEQGLAMAARVQAATELAIAEGLAALCVGDRLAELGVDLYLGKPYQEEELLRHLRDMLGLQEAAAP